MARFRLSIAEISVLTLVATLLFMFWSILNQAEKARSLAVERAYETAQIMSQFAQSAHVHYNDSIRGVASEHDIAMTMSPETEPSKVWFPATFSRLLTEDFSRQYPNSKFRIYSDYPFRERDADALDDFATRALATLSADPDAIVRRTEQQSDGSTVIRRAEPIVMGADCVACHNSPKFRRAEQDWQVGDVRGVREVSLVVPSLPSQEVSSILGHFGLVAFATLLSLFFVLPTVRREVAQRTYFRGLSEELTDKTVQLDSVARTDSLSGLSNRRDFDEELATRMTKVDEAVALFMFDVDHFKKVNDTYGHEAGDEVIRTIGRLLRDIFRKEDVVARIGGEEFAVISDCRDAETMIRRIGRFQDAVKSHSFSGGADKFHITFSGALVARWDEEQANALYSRADEMLYQAKSDGRDRILHESQPSPTSSQVA